MGAGKGETYFRLWCFPIGDMAALKGTKARKRLLWGGVNAAPIPEHMPTWGLTRRPIWEQTEPLLGVTGERALVLNDNVLTGGRKGALRCKTHGAAARRKV